MDVTCERCGTEYEFDETLLSGRGTTVKCTNCGHVFRVYPPGQRNVDRATSSWKLRHMDTGRVELIESLRELQQRISQGVLSAHDEISRGDQGWKPLGAIAELETFFAAAKQRSSAPPARPSSAPMRPRQKTLVGAAPVTRSAPPSAQQGPTSSNPPPATQTRTSSTPPRRRRQATVIGHAPVPRSTPPPTDPPTPAQPTSDPPRAATSSVPPARQVKTTRSPQPPAPQTGYIDSDPPAPPATRSSVPPVYLDEDDDLPTLPKRGTRWPMLLLLLGLVGALIYWQWPKVAPMVGLAPVDNTSDALVDAAEAGLRDDTVQGYEQAIANYTQALSAGGPVQPLATGSSRAHALLAQALRTSNPDEPRVTDLARQAKQLAEQALAQGSTVDATIAMADALRLTGSLNGAEAQLRKAQALPNSRTAEFFRVSGWLAADKADDLAAANADAEQAAALDDRPRYRLLHARSLIGSQQLDQAREQVTKILAATPAHPQALSLLQTIEDAAKPKTDGGATVAQAPAQEPKVEDEVKPVAPAKKEPPPKVQKPAGPKAKPKTKAKTKAKRAAPVKGDAYDEQGEARSDSGDALDDLVDGRPTETQDYGWYMRQARAALAGGQTDRARIHYESALEARPGSGEATVGLGQVAMKERKPSLARRYFRAATQRGYAEGYYHLGNAYRALGDTDQAIAAYYTYTKRASGGPNIAAAKRAIEELQPKPAPKPAEPDKPAEPAPQPPPSQDGT